MEALWHLEDKLKLSTHGAVVLLVCTASLVMGVCAATVLKRRSVAKRDQPVRPKRSETHCICSWGGSSMKRVLMGTVRWCGASKWGEQNAAATTWQDGPSPSPLLGSRGKEEEEGPVRAVGWQSHNSESPVWQRPILMGEKCEMPRFSGLILYDERGRQLHNEPPKCGADINKQVQEKTAAAGRTTLRDLL